MIAQLKGIVDRKRLGAAVIDVGGVGYLVSCAESTLAKLPVGATATLRIHTAVRDDAIELFGFATELEEALFHELVRVPGVGPRMAMNILGGGEPDVTAQAIVQGDHGALRKLPGVGKKTAERLVVDLRERLAPLVSATGGTRRSKVQAAVGERDELLQALGALGYKPAEAERLAALARDRAEEGASTEELIREALRAR